MADKLKKFASFTLVIAFILTAVFFYPEKSTLDNDVVEIQSVCNQLSNKEQCYAKAFGKLTERTNMTYAFSVLRDLQKSDLAARGCHFIAHSITIAETEKNPARWKEVMNAAPSDCSYGATHGALEYYASTFPESKIPQNQISGLCNNPDTNNCTHGLGHVLLVINENDIDFSALTCEALPHDENAKFECLTGVFMERITAINLEIHGLAGKEALNWPARVPELEKLCREQSGTRSVACWKEIVHAVIVKYHNNTQRVVDFCETGPGEKETRECIDHSIGIIAASYNFDLSKASIICDAKAKALDFKSRCYPHLVSSVLSTVPQEMPAAERFCSSLEERYLPSCQNMVANFKHRTSDTIKVSD